MEGLGVKQITTKSLISGGGSNEFSRKALPPENCPAEFKSRRSSRRRRRSDSKSTQKGGRRRRRRKDKPHREWSLGATHGPMELLPMELGRHESK